MSIRAALLNEERLVKNIIIVDEAALDDENIVAIPIMVSEDGEEHHLPVNIDEAKWNGEAFVDHYGRPIEYELDQPASDEEPAQ